MTEQIEPRTAPAPAWEYADAPESTDIVRLDDRYGLFIGGEFVEPKSGRWFPTIEPATEAYLSFHSAGTVNGAAPVVVGSGDGAAPAAPVELQRVDVQEGDARLTSRPPGSGASIGSVQA